MSSFDIPEPYVWDESFRTTYAVIDDQHKGLFEGIFNLEKDPRVESLIEATNRMADHFLAEQAIMEGCQYEGAAEHRRIHVQFLSDMINMSSPVSKEDIDFCKTWLVNHIKTIDFKYKGKLDIPT